MKKVEREDDDGHIVLDSFPLTAGPLTRSKTFILAEEDPAIYKEDVGFNPPREWPDEPLPVSNKDLLPTVTKKHIQMALSVHHAQVKYLHSLGVDACKEYAAQRVDYILEEVVAGDVKCKVCGESKSSTQSLKNHIRARHMETTPYECKTCHKYFGDSSTHKAHLKKHQKGPDVEKFPCDFEGCSKVYSNQSRLTQHKKIHDPANHVACKWCGKVFNAKKNCTTHEKSCDKQPGGRKGVPRDIKCEFCPKDFIHQKDYKYHLKTAHASRAGKKTS